MQGEVFRTIKKSMRPIEKSANTSLRAVPLAIVNAAKGCANAQTPLNILHKT